MTEASGVDPKKPRTNDRFVKSNRSGSSCVFEPEQLQSLLKEARNESDLYGALLTVCAFSGAKISEITNARWKDVHDDRFELYNNRNTAKPKRLVKTTELMSVLKEWYTIQSRNGAPNNDDFIFPGRKLGTPITRQSVDIFLRTLCGKLNIKGASTHSFRLTRFQQRSSLDIAHNSGYSARTLGVFRHDNEIEEATLDNTDTLPKDGQTTPPPPLILSDEWGALSGVHEWQLVGCVANSIGELIPHAPAVNGLYAVRYNSIQAYVGMAVDLNRRIAKNLRHAPRMIGSLPGGSTWVLPIPRIYNLSLLEELCIQQTSPCLNHVWDDLRFQVFPQTQSSMSPGNKLHLIDVIRTMRNDKPRMSS